MALRTSAEAFELEKERNGRRDSLSSGPYPGINFPATSSSGNYFAFAVDTVISNATIAKRVRRWRNAAVASVFPHGISSVCLGKAFPSSLFGKRKEDEGEMDRE